jgi:predicted transcriptional regulator
LPPIPPAPVRKVMVQLSIKAPIDLVDRLESMATATRAQKQAIIAAALDAYMRGHGY